MEKISILLPTRKRFSIFVESINSLINNASDIKNFEILVALDSDDIETINAIKNIQTNIKNISIFIYERQSYHNLHFYYNNLANESLGTSLFLWNDDAVMMTKDWDLEILNNHKNFVVLSPKVINMENYWLNQGVLFPIIPKQWINLTKTWSPYRGCDSWIDYIGKKLNIINKLETVMIKHDRYDLTGNNLDDTYNEGRIGGEEIMIYHDILENHYKTIKNYLNDNN